MACLYHELRSAALILIVSLFDLPSYNFFIFDQILFCDKKTCFFRAIELYLLKKLKFYSKIGNFNRTLIWLIIQLLMILKIYIFNVLELNNSNDNTYFMYFLHLAELNEKNKHEKIGKKMIGVLSKILKWQIISLSRAIKFRC